MSLQNTFTTKTLKKKKEKKKKEEEEEKRILPKNGYQNTYHGVFDVVFNVSSHTKAK
jgi:hypothetical protein